jgi:hypothetical protein
MAAALILRQEGHHFKRDLCARGAGEETAAGSKVRVLRA